MSSSKELYRIICNDIEYLPVFSMPWWLDSVCEEINWDVAIVYRDNNISGVLPYTAYQKFNMSIISQPQLTQKLGPTLIYPKDISYRRKVAFEKETITELVKKLPRHHKFEQICDHTLENWLPFYWLGFEQTTRYSYVLDDNSDADASLRNFSASKRREVHKALRTLNIDYKMEVEEFYDFHRHCLQKEGKTISYGLNILRNIDMNDASKQNHELIRVSDILGNTHSALLLIWDKYTTYNLISAINPEFKKSGSTSLMVFEAIKNATNRNTKFDFEGSMIEEVEFSFRQFGGKQISLPLISKYNSRALKLWNFLRNNL